MCIKHFNSTCLDTYNILDSLFGLLRFEIWAYEFVILWLNAFFVIDNVLQLILQLLATFLKFLIKSRKLDYLSLKLINQILVACTFDLSLYLVSMFHHCSIEKRVAIETFCQLFFVIFLFIVFNWYMMTTPQFLQL